MKWKLQYQWLMLSIFHSQRQASSVKFPQSSMFAEGPVIESQILKSRNKRKWDDIKRVPPKSKKKIKKNKRVPNRLLGNPAPHFWQLPITDWNTGATSSEMQLSRERLGRGGKSTQKVLMARITTMVWSLSKTQTSWGGKSNGPCEALLQAKLGKVMEVGYFRI